MIEEKAKVKKDNVTKEIAINLLSDYINMGWTKVEETKVSKFKKNINEDK